MGRFTDGALQLNDSTKTVKKARPLDKFQALNSHEDYTPDFPMLHKTSLHGSVVIKDLSGNSHVLYHATTAETKGKKHVETVLFDKLDAWAKSGLGLPSAKIIFFINNSPCKRCTNQLFERCKALAKTLGRGSGEFQFSFVFKNYYLHGQHGWSDADEAYEAYCQVTQASALEWFQGARCMTKVLIRQYSETKGGNTGPHSGGFKDCFPARYAPR